jgi:hypothetical protein
MLNISKFFLVGLLSAFAGVGSSLATTTLTFSSGAVARMSGFGDAAGTPTNGLRYGMVIDTLGDGFDNSFVGSTYDSFDNTVSGFLSRTIGGVSAATDDYYFTTGLLTSSQNAVAGGGETGTQVSTITSLVGAPNGTDGLISGVTSADAFSIIWFATSPTAEGSNYGMFRIPAFVLPASGTSVSFASNFTGNDAAKAANLQFTTAIPEPSRMMLLGLGVMGLGMRRRRVGI